MRARSRSSKSPPRGFAKPFSRVAHTKYVVLAAVLILGIALVFQTEKIQKHSIRVPARVTTLSIEEYDLPTLLKVPLMIQESSPAVHFAIDERASRLSNARPNSVIALYRSIPSRCAMQPYIPHVKQALRLYGEAKGRRPKAQEEVLRKNETLLLNIATMAANPNGISLSAEFLAQAIFRAKQFSTVVLMPSLGENGTMRTAETDVEHLMKSLRNEHVNVIRHTSRGDDDDVYLMYIASNLMVHRGPFSALGALVNTGTVYYTSELDPYLKKNQFKWLLNNGKSTAEVNTTIAQRTFKAMGPIAPTCCKFEPFGRGDGEKIICANAKSFIQKSCWILSLGCQGKFSFENTIAEKTSCHIHTFDCTGTWAVPQHLEGRLTIHKTCLGGDDDKRENFVGWEKIIAMGATKGASKMPSLVKMDIEGSEYPVLQPLLGSGREALLPKQWAIEIHAFQRTPEYVGELFHNFSRRGYSLIHRADNPYCAHCSEVTIIKDADLPPVV